MPNSKIILTKTNRPNATPHPNDLDYGELAINYEDGLLFFKNASNRISKIASSGSFSQLTRHLADRENPHEVTKAQIKLDRVDNSNDLEKPISTSTQAALDVKVNLSTLNAEYYNKAQTDGRITTKFGEIRIQVEDPAEASPAGNLSYDKDSNTFIFTEATIPTAQSLGVLESASVRIDSPVPVVGSGALKYVGDGVFTYDRPTIGGLDGYAKSEIGLSFKTLGDSDGTLTYNDGIFTYDQPTIDGLTDGKITLIDGVLDVAGFATDAELDAITTTESQNTENLQSQIDSNDIDINTLQREVSNNNADISSLEAKDTDFETRISTNETDISALEAKDTELKASIDVNANDLRTAEGLISSNNSTILAVESRVDNNSSAISTLSTKISTNEVDITDLTTRINTNETDISELVAEDINLQDQITNNEGNITSIQAQIDANDVDNAALRALITTNDNSGDVTTLGSRVNDNDASIESLQVQITSNDDDIAALQAEDTDFETRISTNEASIPALQEEVTNNVRRISANETSITNLQEKDTAQDEVISNKVTNLGAVTGIQQLTQAAYDALTPNASTVYIIVG